VDWSRGDAGGAQDERQLFAAARPRPGGEVRMEGFAVGAPARFSVQPGGRRPGFANRLRQLRPRTVVLHFERQPFVRMAYGPGGSCRAARYLARFLDEAMLRGRGLPEPAVALAAEVARVVRSAQAKRCTS